MPQGNVEYPPNVFGSREREYRHQLLDEAVSVTRVEKEKILSVYTWDGNKPKGPSFYQAEKEEKKEPDEDSKHPSPPEGESSLMREVAVRALSRCKVNWSESQASFSSSKKQALK